MEVPKRHLEGLDKMPSVLALGTSSFGDPTHAYPIYDTFFELGGNFLDTGWVYGIAYGAGICEKTLGAWIESRGVRSQAVIFAKGGHPPHCDPEAIMPQLEESLDRLRTTYVDLYMVHRDNHDVPVEEFVDALACLMTEGIAHSYGFSNWSTERVGAALNYARLRGIPTPVAVSNNLSLAEMVRPIYPGCISVFDKASRSWYQQERMALIPWSSQGRGVFTSVGKPDDLATSSLADCWYSEGNVQRLDRAQRLAKTFKVLPVNIALAYVLNQPFPTFPIIGPRSTDELLSSVPAVDLRLTQAEMDWLDLEGDALEAGTARSKT